MSRIDAPPAPQAADFGERGAYLPLTSPALAGARVRRRRDALELLLPGRVPHPLEEAASLRTLTVHDTRLLDRIRRLRDVRPGAVREACCETLAEGFAGRRAMAAAAAAMDTDREARLRTHYHLVLNLAGVADTAIRGNPQAHLVQALQRLTALCDAEQESVASALTQLSGLMAPLGLGESVGTARLPAALAGLREFRRAAESLALNSDQEAETIEVVARTADIALACLAGALAETRVLVGNVPALTRSWLTAPGATATRLGRAAWLADGWAWLCQAWTQAAEHDPRPLGVDVIAQLLPALPAEVADWPGFPGGPVPLAPARPIHGDAHAPSRLDAIARNETILACSL